MKLDLWVKESAHLHSEEYNSFPLFFSVLASSLSDFMVCFSRTVFISCFRLHMQICMEGSAVVPLPDCFIHTEVVFLEKNYFF